MACIHIGYTYPKELKEAKTERCPVIIPVGTMEYHSTHCPYGCNTLVAMELACRKAARKLIFEYLEETDGSGWWGTEMKTSPSMQVLKI